MSSEDVNEEGYLDGQEQTSGGANAFAVEGVPAWWDRMGHQQPAFSTVCSTPGGAMYFEHPNVAATDMRPMAAFSHQPVLYQGQHVSVNNKSDSGDGTTEGNQLQAAAGAVFQSQNVDQVMPHTQLELGPSMGPASYTYADPYYGGIFTTYDAQAMSMMHPQILGMHQSRMPLPLEIAEEEPVYVNAKQYNGIMRRRQSRAKAESENKLVKARKPYLHESRHLHAIRRARGCGGRFLNTKGDEMKVKPDSFTALEGSLIPTEHVPKKLKRSETFKGCAL